MLTGSTPIFAVSDVEETIRYYKDVLGFESSWLYGEPPTFGAAQWGKVSIMFGLEPELAARVEGHGHWMDVDDVNALYEQHKERGVTIVSEIEDKPWGFREYTVRDLNGYHIRFTGSPTHISAGAGALPEGVEIQRRVPTAEEFEKVAIAAFYKDSSATELLAATWGGIVALSKSGEAIGVLRIMCDAPGWYSVWDVAVLPEWQGNRVGSAMMEAAAAMVHEESPGAWLYLFTMKQPFYERLGFEVGSVTLRKV
ncbi:MAG TPA: GNAT family N-acetyltransferase [Fimbriimonas sp.]|nr:GNAT family N-acetyltransferase [Fimbriimonas sp.]